MLGLIPNISICFLSLLNICFVMYGIWSLMKLNEHIDTKKTNVPPEYNNEEAHQRRKSLTEKQIDRK